MLNPNTAILLLLNRPDLAKDSSEWRSVRLVCRAAGLADVPAVDATYRCAQPPDEATPLLSASYYAFNPKIADLATTALGH